MSTPEQQLPPNLDDIRKAAETIEPFIHKTPIMTSSSLDDMLGLKLYFKCENFQKTGSFKVRGSYNLVDKVCSERKEKRPPILVAFSSGNHAQAVAKIAQVRSLKAHIVMPQRSAKVKIASVKDFGATVHLCDNSSDAISTMLEEVMTELGPDTTLIPPFDNPYIIAGQGTIGLEVLEQVPLVDTIVVAVSGGGLSAGICIAVKNIKPSVRIFAAEPEKADDCAQSFAAKERIVMKSYPETIADGLTAPIGTLTWPVLQEHLSGVITVSEEEILSAMYLSLERLKILMEPSAAVAMAAAFKLKEFSTDTSAAPEHVCVVVCGGNADFASLPHKQ